MDRLRYLQTLVTSTAVVQGPSRQYEYPRSSLYLVALETATNLQPVDGNKTIVRRTASASRLVTTCPP